jgi:hypothetical protein
MMDPTIKAAWLAALRNPEAKQARGQLRKEDAMCCLGVLCEVVRKLNPTIGRWQVNLFTTNKPQGIADQVLAVKIMVKAGLKEQNPVIHLTSPEVGAFTSPNRVLGSSYSLAEINDNGANFAQIADIIEREL